jgi:hypothetical protein
VIEIPVTQMEQAPGSLRHLQLCAVSFLEMREAMLHARLHHHPVITIVSHSFELATRDGLRANSTLCDRFESLCAYLANNRERLPTSHFSDLADVPLGVEAEPLPAKRMRTARRKLEQFWSDTRYEQPANAFTALSGSSMSGLEAFAPLMGL